MVTKLLLAAHICKYSIERPAQRGRQTGGQKSTVNVQYGRGQYTYSPVQVMACVGLSGAAIS
jgi:hypothetical protein